MSDEKFKNFHTQILHICERAIVGKDFDMKENVDSLSRAEIIITAETIFGIELTNEEMISYKTYGDLEKMIRGKLK
mgnify:CR=1 FL=1